MTRPVALAVWFFDHDIHVFPTVHKVPAVPKGTSWKDYRCSRAQAAGFKEYGVPLGMVAVVDSDSAVTEAWAAAHLPATPFKVTTGAYHDGSPGRGRHRYYWLRGDAPHLIHRHGLTIEFKHAGQYVVGPGSRRRDGVVYEADPWSWDIRDVPIFPVDTFVWDDRPPAAHGSGTGLPYEIPEGTVAAGERHYELFRFLRHVKSFVDNKAEGRQFVTLFNQQRCRPPLPEDDAFERWFDRAWHQRDRPFTPPLAAPLRELLGLRDVGELL